jgi:repressor LexA
VHHGQSTGSAPTLKQIAEAISVSSLATVHEHLAALENKNLIKRKRGKTRSMELVNADVIFQKEV